MTRLIEKATGHFESVLARGLLGPVSVPEWEEDIWYKPSSTMAEEAIIIELTQQGKTTEALVVTLIIKAKDKDGKSLFDMGDKLKLMRGVDPAIILRVVSAMNVEHEAVEAQLGN